MSVPPNGPPPNNNSGCLKAFGISCAVLLVLGIVGVFFIGRTFQGVFGQVAGITKTATNGVLIQQAVVQYHQKHGRYPDALSQLVSDKLIDGKILHSDMDPDPRPGHVSWVYARPTEGAPGSTPILKFHFRLNVPGANRQQAPESDLVINLDGSSPRQTRPATR